MGSAVDPGEHTRRGGAVNNMASTGLQSADEGGTSCGTAGGVSRVALLRPRRRALEAGTFEQKSTGSPRDAGFAWTSPRSSSSVSHRLCAPRPAPCGAPTAGACGAMIQSYAP
jgi:hypothetical protein